MSFSSRVEDYLKLVKDGSSESFLDEVDFAVQRTNFQGNDQDRHIYQSFRAVTPFLMFAGFSATSSLALGITKIANKCPNWNLGTHFKFSLAVGTTYMLFHHYVLTPLEINHILKTKNSSYTQLCHTVLDARDDRNAWHNAFNLQQFIDEEKRDVAQRQHKRDQNQPNPQLTPQEPTTVENFVDRRYFAVPNFQHSGHSAVVAVDPDNPTEYDWLGNTSNLYLDGVPLTDKELFDDINASAKLYRSTRLDFCVNSKGDFDEYSAKMLKKQISNYCELHGINMPGYFESFKAFHQGLATLERPVDFLHLYRDDDKTIRGHLPPAFQSPQDILAVQKSRHAIQEEVNRQSREQFKQQQQNQ